MTMLLIVLGLWGLMLLGIYRISSDLGSERERR